MTAERPTGGPLDALVGFVGALRQEGLTVTSGQALTYCRAVAAMDVDGADDLYWAGRACLLSRRADSAAYDRIFRCYFGGTEHGLRLTVSGQLPRSSVALTLEQLALRPAAEGAEGAEDAPTGARASASEVLRRKRFADCTAEEIDALRALMARLRLEPPLRRARRTRPASRGAEHDLRRTVRRALRSHGEVLRPAWRHPRERPRRLVLILDVSGSMAGYSRALLQFAHSATSAAAKTEVFCFGTRLTRVTQQLRRRQPDQALSEAAEAVLDWEGGTRIGDALHHFIQTWGRRGLARGAVIVICSDGLECGDPAVLEAAMSRLRRLAHRVVWVNPLKGDDRYQPLARGMSAALPHLDALVSGHNLASLESLAALLPELRTHAKVARASSGPSSR